MDHVETPKVTRSKLFTTQFLNTKAVVHLPWLRILLFFKCQCIIRNLFYAVKGSLLRSSEKCFSVQGVGRDGEIWVKLETPSHIRMHHTEEEAASLEECFFCPLSFPSPVVHPSAPDLDACCGPLPHLLAWVLPLPASLTQVTESLEPDPFTSACIPSMTLSI